MSYLETKLLTIEHLADFDTIAFDYFEPLPEPYDVTVGGQTRYVQLEPPRLTVHLRLNNFPIAYQEVQNYYFDYHVSQVLMNVYTYEGMGKCQGYALGGIESLDNGLFLDPRLQEFLFYLRKVSYADVVFTWHEVIKPKLTTVEQIIKDNPNVIELEDADHFISFSKFDIELGE